MDKSKFPKKVREFEEVEGGEYDSHGFYYTPNNSFWDDEGYYFNREGFDIYGGYYDDRNVYVPGKGWNKKLGRYNYVPSFDDEDLNFDDCYGGEIDDLCDDEFKPSENLDDFVATHDLLNNDDEYNRFVSQMKSNKIDDILFGKDDDNEPQEKNAKNEAPIKNLESKPVKSNNPIPVTTPVTETAIPKPVRFNYYNAQYGNNINKSSKGNSYSNQDNNYKSGKGKKNYNYSHQDDYY